MAIEVKAARSLQSKATRGIEQFRNAYPDEFHRGFVLHAGDHIEPLGDNVWALPFSALWTIGEPADVSLKDRLARVVDTIRHTSEGQPLGPPDTKPAMDLLRRLTDDLSIIAETLRRLGCNTTTHPLIGMSIGKEGIGEEARRAGWTPRQAGVQWTAKTGLGLAMAHECILWVTADLTGSMIEWNLTCEGAYENTFDSPFTTGTEPGAYSAISGRLNLFVDALPVIVERLA